jgi:hypothetical protein
MGFDILPRRKGVIAETGYVGQALTARNLLFTRCRRSHLCALHSGIRMPLEPSAFTSLSVQAPNVQV